MLKEYSHATDISKMSTWFLITLPPNVHFGTIYASRYMAAITNDLLSDLICSVTQNHLLSLAR